MGLLTLTHLYCVVESVEVLTVVEVPEHRLGVLAAGGAQGSVGGHGDLKKVILK